MEAFLAYVLPTILVIGPLLFAVVHLRDILRSGPGSARPIRHMDRATREQYFRDCIDRCENYLKMVAGEGNVEIYTPGVGNALRGARRRGVSIQMIVGPILMVGDSDRQSELLRLAREGTIELFFSAKRIPVHFRTGGNGHVYWERPHKPGEIASKRGFEHTANLFESKPFVRTFEQLLARPEVRKPPDPETCFRQHTRGEIDAIVAELEGAGIDLSVKDEIYWILKKNLPMVDMSGNHYSYSLHDLARAD